MIHVAPSILSADFSRLAEEIMKMERAGATFIHLDVMDGVFVPNTTFGPELVQKIAPFCGEMIKDTHLMIVHPEEQIEAFASAGSDIITVHYEAFDSLDDLKDCLRKIRLLGVKAGVSIKPKTAPETLLPFFEDVDLILVMSVEPGKGGQAFMENALPKISFLREAIRSSGKDIYLEVDGGINGMTGKACIDAGADVLVAGSYLYGHEDYADRIAGLLHG